MSITSNIADGAVEIIKDKLYWISADQPPEDLSNAFFFNIDEELKYKPFLHDFGPLDLGKVYKYVTELEGLFEDPTFSEGTLYHYTSTDTAKRTNAACLMGCFQVIVLGRTAEEAWEPFKNVEPSFPGYRDASYSTTNYRVEIIDILRGLEYAIKLKWFNIKTFNLEEYEHREKVENGDLNWIIPGKFIGFSTPHSNKKDSKGYIRYTPEDYVPYFEENNVKMVIRLNSPEYEKNRFIKNGIKHKDMYFKDGSCPAAPIISTFLKEVEKEEGAIAVHCKAGLGRTGTLIGLYAMKHYKFPAADFLGWIRLARPGSVLGPQQRFLLEKERAMHTHSEDSSLFKSVFPLVRDFWRRREQRLSEETMETLSRRMDHKMTLAEKKIAEEGELGQAKRLMLSKVSSSISKSTEGSEQDFSFGEESPQIMAS